jgi:hypothetical protein
MKFFCLFVGATIMYGVTEDNYWKQECQKKVAQFGLIVLILLDIGDKRNT